MIVKKRLADWMLENGVGFAYTLLVTAILGVFAIGMLVVFVFISWWDRIR